MNLYLFTRKLSLLAFAGLLSQAVGAEAIKVDIKPGLWQTQSKLVGNSSQAIKDAQKESAKKLMEEMKSHLASMPPEQRAQMEAIMEGQGMKLDAEGFSMQNDKLQVSAEGVKAKQCITQAELDQGFAPNPEDHCENKLTQLSKNKYTVKFACGGEEKSTGEGEFEVIDSKSYRGKMHMTSIANGKPVAIDVEMQGQWLGSDCGDIKPESDEDDGE